MLASQLAGGEDERIRRAAPRQTRAAVRIFKNLAVLMAITLGTMALCFVLSLSDRVVH